MRTKSEALVTSEHPPQRPRVDTHILMPCGLFLAHPGPSRGHTTHTHRAQSLPETVVGYKQPSPAPDHDHPAAGMITEPFHR